MNTVELLTSLSLFSGLFLQITYHGLNTQITLFFFFNLFLIYLAALSLSCDTQGIWLWHVGLVR